MQEPYVSERTRAFNRLHLIGAIALIILLLLLWFIGRGPAANGCCGDAAVAVAPPASSASAASAAAAMPMPSDQTELNAQIAQGKLTLSGTVKNQATKAVMLAAAIAAIGEGNVNNQLNIDTGVNQPAWLAGVVENAAEPGDLFPWFKGRNDGGLVAIGDKVTLTGTVQSEAEKTARGTWALKYFGASTKVDNQLVVVAPVAAATKPDNGCGETIKSRIEFATGKASITPAGKAVLDKVASCLADAKVEVAGHTDDRGKDEMNLKLSQARAQAVADYLVARGLDKAKLTARGYGKTKPIADNATTEGRQANRRIDFTAQ